MSSIAEKVPRIRLNDGNYIPILGFGTFDVDENVVKIAIDAGYRHFDCADHYQNEDLVGSALRKAINEGIVKREDLFITSKVWLTWLGKGRSMQSAQRSLKNLGFHYLDLLLVHWPIPFKQVDIDQWPRDENDQCLFDESLELIDVWKEFEEIKNAGLTRSIGVSNFNSEQIDHLMKNSSTVPAVNQIESHPFLSNSKLFKWMRERGIEMTAYAPLASAGLEWNKNISPLEVPLIKNLAIKYGVTPAAICIKWQIQRGVIAIPKSSTKDRIYSNIDVFDFGMTDEEISSIQALNRDLRNFTFDFYGIGKHKYWPFRIPF